MLLYFCARTKEFIPGREPPSEVVNREAEKKTQKSQNPQRLKGPVSPLLCREVQWQSRKQAQHPRHLCQSGGFSEVRCEGLGRKDSWENFIWILSQVVG